MLLHKKVIGTHRSGSTPGGRSLLLAPLLNPHFQNGMNGSGKA